MSIIEINNLVFERDSKVIFDNISLTMEEGKITAIMGPSGCGKTTLLKIIGGQLKPQKGSIFIKNKNISNLNKDDLYELRRDIGVLFQNGALFSDLNVYENIAFPVREYTNLSEELVKALVLEKLKAVGLFGTNLLMPSQLSIGMAKRIALARTIVLNPSIIMYDEPFSGQDPISMETLIRLIVMLNKSFNITSLIVSHDVDEVMEIADYIYIINEKKIVIKGTPFFIKNAKDNFVKYFINRKISYNNIIKNLKVDYDKNN